MKTSHHVSDCEISAAVLRQNGKPQYWCRIHHFFAWGRSDERLTQCHGAELPYEDNETLYLDPDHYPGGISLWSPIPVVYNTIPPKNGILVHARMLSGGCTVIDAMFRMVFVRNPIGVDFISINEETASRYFTSCFLQVGGGFFAMKWPGFDRPL